MAPLLKSMSVSFALAGGLLKRNKKSKNPSLSHLSGGARHPRREREQCEVEEAQLQIGRLFLFFRQTQQKKARRREKLLFCFIHTLQSLQESGLWLTGIAQPLALASLSILGGHLASTRSPLPALLHAGLRQLELAEPVVVMISRG